MPPINPNPAPRRYSLDVVPIASPCTEDWNRMRGGEAVKFCDKCQLHVHNLSVIPAEAAERLLAQREGRLCVRYEVEPPAAPTAQPTREAIELRRKRNRPAAWWSRAAAMLGLSFLGGAGLSLGGCGEHEEVMGDVVAPATLDPQREQSMVGMVAMPAPAPAPRTIMGKPAPPPSPPAPEPACEPGEPLILTKPAPTPPIYMMGGARPNVVMGEIEAPPPAPKPAPPATQPAK